MSKMHRWKCPECDDRVFTYREPSEGEVCFKCQNAAESVVNAAKARELGLPALTGSAAQVAYAETLRMSLHAYLVAERPVAMVALDSQYALPKLRSQIIDLIGVSRDELARVGASYTTFASQVIDDLKGYGGGSKVAAAWKLEYGDRITQAQVERMTPEQRAAHDAEEERKADEKAKAEAAAAQARKLRDEEEAASLLKCEAPVVDDECVVSLRDGFARLSLPKRHEGFNGTVKSLGYGWDADARTWRRKPLLASGDPLDVVATDCLALLDAGYHLRVRDSALRDRIISGPVGTVHVRVITVLTSGKLLFAWEREADLYEEVKKLRGASYEKGLGVSVPASSHEEALDLAQRLGFHVSKGAIARVEEYEKAALTAGGLKRVVKGRKRAVGKAFEAADKPPVLEPVAAGIDDALRD